MLKRVVAKVQRWLSTDHRTKDSRLVRNDMPNTTRRKFFTKAALGAASITGTAGLAKVAVDSVPQADLHDLYVRDELTGEQELTEREYVLMSDEEKTDMVQSFVDHYSEKS